MDKAKRRALAKAKMAQMEKQRPGGIYAIRNTENGKAFLVGCLDLEAARNRFTFSQENGSCLFGQLFSDWEKYGAKAFSFQVLEELPRGEDQSMESYQEDVKVLMDLQREQLDPESLY